MIHEEHQNRMLSIRVILFMPSLINTLKLEIQTNISELVKLNHKLSSLQ